MVKDGRGIGCRGFQRKYSGKPLGRSFPNVVNRFGFLDFVFVVGVSRNLFLVSEDERCKGGPAG
jgi:hypothetical protein